MLLMTRQRKVILDELLRDKSHPTADLLFKKVQRRLPRISLGTIYRNLEILAQNGMIKKIEAPNEPMRFDADISNHCHIKCMRCGRVDDIKVHPRIRAKKAADEAGYKITGYKVEFLGICSTCRTNSQ